MVPGSRQEEEAMSIPTSEDRAHGQELLGQTVVVIGGSSGIGLETARRARAEGASVVLAARDPEQLRSAGLEVGAFRTAALDANDADALERFFGDVPQPIGHVMVIAGGPVYGRLLDMDLVPVNVQLFSDHHGEHGFHALPDLRAPRHDGDRAVACNLDERIGRERSGSRPEALSLGRLKGEVEEAERQPSAG